MRIRPLAVVVAVLLAALRADAAESCDVLV
jgi:hypothetical protein